MYLVYIIVFLSITLAGTVILLYVLWKLCKKHEVDVTPEDEILGTWTKEDLDIVHKKAEELKSKIDALEDMEAIRDIEGKRIPEETR